MIQYLSQSKLDAEIANLTTIVDNVFDRRMRRYETQSSNHPTTGINQGGDFEVRETGQETE